MKKYIEKVTSLIKSHKHKCEKQGKPWWTGPLIVGIVVVCFLGLMVYVFFFSKNEVSFEDTQADSLVETVTNAVQETKDCDFMFALDGVCTEETQLKDGDPRVVAVMFDNHPNARPHTGLHMASVVYEAPVEGNYTRFMGLYPVGHVDLEKIGPVRSARPYFVDWLGEYGTPTYVHVGGSPEALDLIPERNIFDFNEFSKGWYFWRDKNRYAPHNAYTSIELIEEGLTDYEKSMTDGYPSWKFGEVDVCESGCVEDLKITFLPPSFVVEWEYVSSTQKYERSQGYKKHIDTSDDQIMADTIVIQMVDSRVIDDVGRKRITTVGSGKARVFQKGNMIEGTWEKKSISEKTKFFDMEGNEIMLQRGKIWVEVVATGMDVAWQ